ncbi:MAG: hypothetical protein DMD58_08390 [Gemmatimonadetes bacterium]|nr:MAG: hypothetical protein DMD58_08390 [Gemmatimonadota bacterium]
MRRARPCTARSPTCSAWACCFAAVRESGRASASSISSSAGIGWWRTTWCTSPARSVRQQKRIEVVVQLEDWDNTREYDRTGLDQQRTELLDVELPLVTVPLNPGKNLTVICEVVAMNHLLRYSGVDSANAFNERLIRRMREKGGVQQYLEEDYE